MPNQLTYIVIGQAFSGIFVAFLIIPVLPEMMTAANVKFEGRQKQRVNSLSSGLYNAAIGVGQTIGPVLSAFFYEKYGFRSTQDIVASTAVIYGVLYFFCGGGWKAFSSTCSGQAEIVADDHGEGEEKLGKLNDSGQFGAKRLRTLSSSGRRGDALSQSYVNRLE